MSKGLQSSSLVVQRLCIFGTIDYGHYSGVRIDGQTWSAIDRILKEATHTYQLRRWLVTATQWIVAVITWGNAYEAIPSRLHIKTNTVAVWLADHLVPFTKWTWKLELPPVSNDAAQDYTWKDHKESTSCCRKYQQPQASIQICMLIRVWEKTYISITILCIYEYWEHCNDVWNSTWTCIIMARIWLDILVLKYFSDYISVMIFTPHRYGFHSLKTILVYTCIIVACSSGPQMQV